MKLWAETSAGLRIKKDEKIGKEKTTAVLLADM